MRGGVRVRVTLRHPGLGVVDRRIARCGFMVLSQGVRVVSSGCTIWDNVAWHVTLWHDMARCGAMWRDVAQGGVMTEPNRSLAFAETLTL